MTHDQKCTFDPKWCRDCQMQAEARADEWERIRKLLLQTADILSSASTEPLPLSYHQTFNGGRTVGTIRWLATLMERSAETMHPMDTFGTQP